MAQRKEVIEYTAAEKLSVPDYPAIPFIEGDGTGPDIWQATRAVLDEAVSRAYKGSRKIHWKELLAGEKAYAQTGKWLPDDTLKQLNIYRVSIKGPLTTPVGGGFRSLTATLRQELDLYACIRPVKYIPGIPSPMLQPHLVDMVIFRETTEDVYAGLEWKAESLAARKLIRFVKKETGRDIRPDSGIGLKPISRTGTSRLVRMAIKYALENGRKSITLVHKGNVMKYTEGAFRKWGYATARDEFGEYTVSEEGVEKDHQGTAPPGKLLIKDRITDNMFQQILLRPEEYDVLAMPNLNGDYMSDALAAMVGGLGVAPGANIGDKGYAMFEAVHGSAPKYAGQDIANPSSLILSGAMMLNYLGWKKAGDLVREGWGRTISQKIVTYDLARQMEGTTEVKCSQFARAIINNM